MVLAVYSEDNDLEVMLKPWHVRESQRSPPPNLLWSIVGRRRSSFSCLTGFDLVGGVRSIHFVNFFLKIWVCTLKSTHATPKIAYEGFVGVGGETRDTKMFVCVFIIISIYLFYLSWSLPPGLITRTQMWFMVLPNRKTWSRHGTQPVGDFLLISS